MIAAPQAVDQFSNAERLAQLGVAEVVDSSVVTPEQLRDALRRLTSDPAVRDRSADLGRRVRAEGGAARAADEIETLLPGHAAQAAGR